MVKIKHVSAWTIVLAMLMAVTAFAGNRKTGLTGASFLKIGVGARQVALGSAATTLSGDPNSMFWNPAGIRADGTQLGFTHNQWLVDMAHNAVSLTHDVEGIGTVGVGLIHIGLDGIAANRDIAPTQALKPLQADQATDATYSFYDLAVNVTVARQFTDKLALGASLKLIREKIDDLDATAIAGDFGVIYNTGWRNLTLGARMNNLGGDLQYFEFGAPIPLTFSIGAAIDIAKEEDHHFVALVDLTKPQDTPQLYFGGAEWTIMDKLVLRGGYKFGFSGSEDDFGVSTTDEGASFGGGIQIPWGDARLSLNYAFTEFNLLDNTHRFSLNISF